MHNLRHRLKTKYPFVLVQNNASPHTAQATRNFLENRGVEVTDWSFKSPDMNHINHLCDQMVVHVCDMDNAPTAAAHFHMAVK